MKQTAFVLGAALLFTAAVAQAAETAKQPLLVRIADSGFSPRGLHTATQCALYEHHVAIIRWLDDVQSVERRDILLVGNINDRIAEAATGEIKETVLPADLPTLQYVARRLTPDGTEQFVELGSKLNGVRRDNASLAARGLKIFLDSHCGPTGLHNAPGEA